MIQKFLNYFNTLDKHLDTIIESGKFLPYNEKINHISHGHYALTPRIRHHSQQLKYLGEIRNLLIHHHGDVLGYVQLTQEAIDDIEKLAMLVTQPPTVAEYMMRNVMTCSLEDNLRDVIQHNTRHYNHIPVLTDGQLVGGVSEELLLGRIAEQGSIDMSTLSVGDIPLAKPHHYHLIDPDMSIHDAVALLADRGDYVALLVQNDDGIQGIITRHDVPKIVEKMR